ncbi:Putative peptidoglycan binding domain-containing protein [Microbacterium azadirachtae]|uniref:Putative peptidoglycan binding domain-containing protein n=1 Tax=Microbacterium azadirachtae TaxID=582680 RepID=A0A1I6JHC4_9MICO|nr:Putative peptidoglycan binding domain-containing protein [Microbacterium azadirachtae]
MKRAITVIIAFALACGAVVGAVVAYYMLPIASGVLAPNPKETAFPITQVDYSDERALPLEPSFSAGVELRAYVSGIVTQTSCTPGMPVASGKALLTVNGKPVIALAAKEPFYRDLGWGDKGADVDSLRGALSSLGYAVDASGEFDDDVFDALTSLQDTENLATSDGLFHISDFLWVPMSSPAIATCEATVGQSVGPGATVATTARILSSLSVTRAAAEGLVPGARTVSVFEVAVTLPESGVLTDPAVLTQIANAPDSRGKLTVDKDGKAAAISGTSRLVEPLQIAAVPPASVFGVQGLRGCVEAQGGTYPVTVVGANLGMSLVRFDGVPPADVLLHPKPGSCNAAAQG